MNWLRNLSLFTTERLCNVSTVTNPWVLSMTPGVPKEPKEAPCPYPPIGISQGKGPQEPGFIPISENLINFLKKMPARVEECPASWMKLTADPTQAITRPLALSPLTTSPLMPGTILNTQHTRLYPTNPFNSLVRWEWEANPMSGCWHRLWSQLPGLSPSPTTYSSVTLGWSPPNLSMPLFPQPWGNGCPFPSQNHYKD